MATIKQLNIKNRTYYIYQDLINLKDFDPKFLKQDKNHQWTLVFITLAMLQKSQGTRLTV